MLGIFDFIMLSRHLILCPAVYDLDILCTLAQCGAGAVNSGVPAAYNYDLIAYINLFSLCNYLKKVDAKPYILEIFTLNLHWGCPP